MTGNVKAGWYPDPKMAGSQRYWDGKRWTDHVAPQSKPAGVLTVARGVALGIVVAVAAIAVFGSVLAGQRQNDCESENVQRVLNGQRALDC